MVDAPVLIVREAGEDAAVERERDQTMRPRRRWKWLRQSRVRQMDGCSVTEPLKWRLARQLDVSPGTRLSCMVAPQPQGKRRAADQGSVCSPIR